MSPQVLSWSLGVFLLCLLSPWLERTEAQGVDQNTLARIIRYIQDRYHPNMQQYAVAINIPAERCGPGIIPDNIPHFLNDDPQAVRAAINNPNVAVYQGASMIAATRRPTGMPNDFFHSEYLLMREPNNGPTHMQNLLNQNPHGCVIFYTYNSPCDGTCLNPNNNRNILNAIQMFAGHQGPKAFVYNQIFNNNNAGINAQGIAINGNVFLYRCHLDPVGYVCHHCIHENQIRPECLAPHH